MCVVGEIPELGAWKKFTGQMTWTQGHIWVLENLSVASKHFFCYKYVLMQHEKPKTWEQGQNRIADLRLLPEIKGATQDMLREINVFQASNPAQT